MNYEKLNILKNREGKRLKRLRKRKRWKKGQNVLKYTRTQPKSIRVNRNPYTSKVENISIVAEASFTLFDQPESCIKLIRRLDKVKKINTRGYIIVEIDLSGVVWIDQGAISFLLAKINELKQFRGKRIKIWGNSPKHKGAQHIFNESGFLDYMKDMFGKKFRGSIKSHIFKVGSDKMLNRNVGKAIEKSLKYITGSEQRYGPLYSIINEMCLNSVEWANEPNSLNQNWFLSVNQIEVKGERILNFTLSDVGYGIINTLYRNFAKHISDALEDKPEEVLARAFDRKYGSKTKERNRNRGLPLIKKTSDKGFVKNLLVITNNVTLDFNSKEKSKKIDISLPGTFYNWDVDLNCIELWKNQRL